jgi:hypothetical protein
MAKSTTKAEAQPEAQYAPPTSQVDLAARLESGNASDRILSTSDEAARRQKDLETEEGTPTGQMVVEGNDLSGYVATDPIYQNYANETEAPLVGGDAEGEENPENKLFSENFGQLPRHSWEISEETVAKVQAAAEKEENDSPAVTDVTLTEPSLTKPVGEGEPLSPPSGDKS